MAIAIDGTSCTITYGTGADSMLAICIVQGDLLSAAYAVGDAATLLVYRIRDDGTLEGI